MNRSTNQGRSAFKSRPGSGSRKSHAAKVGPAPFIAMAVLALLLGLGADIFADGPSTLAIFSSLLAALAFDRALLICGPVLLYNLLAALFPKGGWVFSVLMAEGGGFEALALGTEYWFVCLHALAFLAALKIHGDHSA